MSLAVRPVLSLPELGEHLRGLIEDADEERSRLEDPSEARLPLPGMSRRPTRTQVARYLAELETKAEAWREVLAAMGQEA